MPSEGNIIQRLISNGLIIIGNNNGFQSHPAISPDWSGQLAEQVKGEKAQRSFPSFFFFASLWLPSVLVTLPLLLVLHDHYREASWARSIDSPVWTVLCLLLIAILAFLLARLIDNFGRLFEGRIFRFRLYYPSTYLLLYSDKKLPRETKDAFRQKFYATFKASFPVPLDGQEDDNNYLAEVARSMDQVKAEITMSFRLHYLTILYDYTRNFVAAAKSAGILALLLLSYALLIHNNTLLLSGLLFVVFALLVRAIRRRILTIAAENYALQLIDEFMHS